MTKSQRYQYEMLVRVRNFGTEQLGLFPEGSPGGGKFTRIAAAVAAIEEHLKNRVLGSRGVKPATREAVIGYLKAIAKAARRVTGDEGGKNPFKLPRRRSLAVVLATAKAFLEAATRRQERFVEFGLPPTFISDLTELVTELEGAVNTHLDSKALRASATNGIATALRDGLALARDLDVLVELATSQDPVLAATWRAVRTVEGQASSSPATTTEEEAPGTEPASSAQPAGSSEATGPASPAATSPEPAAGVTTVEAPALVLEKAS